MRVAMFSAALPEPERKPGGVDVYVSRLAEHLTRAGHEVRVYSFSPAPPGASYGHSRMRPHRFASSALARITIVPVLLNGTHFPDADVLHLHSDDWFFVRRDLPTVRTFHGSALYEGIFAARWRRRLTQGAIVPLEMRAARLATARFAVAPGTETWLNLDGHLPCGTDEPTHDLEPHDVPTVLFVGTWAGRKRGAFLRELFVRQVLPRVPNAQLWMVSDHCEEAHGVRWFARPSEEEMAALYARSWVIAAPSLYEGFGVYYLEAMATDTMVVATPNPGAEYVLDRGRAGRLVADHEFGEAIVEALCDAELRGQFVKRGRQRAAEFSWARTVKAHEHAYELAISRWGQIASLDARS